jgi:Site-specific DNA methylase
VKVLDLFCGLKGWSQPFAARGHDVVSLDLDPRFHPDIQADILEVEFAELAARGPYEIVLASPPCEGFTVMNISKNWTGPEDEPPHMPKSLLAQQALRIVRQTVNLIYYLDPQFWVIENPRAKLRKLPIMTGLERRTVTYCQYGDTNMKPTDLWGGFPPSLELHPPCNNGDPCHTSAPRGSKTPGSTQGKKGGAERAVIPYELAHAVCLAAEHDLTNTVVKATLF